VTAHVDELDRHGGKSSRMIRSTVELRGHDVALRDIGVLNGLTLFGSIVGSCRVFLPSNQFPIWRQSLDRFFVAISKEATTWQVWRT
jgi:hypothetical protein